MSGKVIAEVSCNEKEICSLVDACFENGTEFDSAKIFRNASFRTKSMKNHPNGYHTFCLYWCRGWDLNP